MKNNNIESLQKTAQQIRRLIIQMLLEAGSGHPGGSLSAVEIVTALYFNIMQYDPHNPTLDQRDRFILSKGHACPVQYAAMAVAGFFPEKELLTLRKLGSRLQGHPSSSKLPGIEISTGSLGQGLSVAVGMALAFQRDQKTQRVYCLMGDGELAEGQIWEAAMTASHYHLSNLIGFVDVNGLQIDGFTKDVKNTEPLIDKWQSFGWHVISIDGHDFNDILQAVEEAQQQKNQPTVILAKTIKGKNVSFMENQAGWHGKSPSQEQAQQALEELK